MKDVNFLEQNCIDVERGLELLGDIDTYNEMLDDFLTEVEPKINRLNIFKDQNDMANYAIDAHSLKSDSKYFGFTKLIDLAYQHELESKANNLDFIKNNFDLLKTETYRIIEIINVYLGHQ